MGWTSSHLHAFEHDGDRYAEPGPDFEMDGADNQAVISSHNGAHYKVRLLGSGTEKDVELEVPPRLVTVEEGLIELAKLG